MRTFNPGCRAPFTIDRRAPETGASPCQDRILTVNPLMIRFRKPLCRLFCEGQICVFGDIEAGAQNAELFHRIDIFLRRLASTTLPTAERPGHKRNRL